MKSILSGRLTPLEGGVIAQPRHRWSVFARLAAAAVLILGAVFAAGATAHTAQAAASQPCDIYGSNGTPCVAAHSSVRALYAGYNGPLYQVRRQRDGALANIGVLEPGGYANGAAQDTFCAGTYCEVTMVYDQSPRHNNLTIEGPGGNGGPNTGVNANALPLTVAGHHVYGLYFAGHQGYRNNRTSGVAVNGQPEGMYMVASGTHVNNMCCFDYGNAETNNLDNGNGHMDAVYLGTWCQLPPCNGRGPWVMADMENGLFQSNTGGSQNPSNTGMPLPYVTGIVKNNGQNHFALRQGNAQNGGLTTTYNGPLPTNRPGYTPMHQEGAIVLGTGGDNSNYAVGSFFEGVMTAGVPSDSADNQVQANIVAAGYGSNTGGTTGGTTTGGTTTGGTTTGGTTTGGTTTGGTTTGGTTTGGTTTGGTGGGCTAAYQTSDDWGAGFVANVTVKAGSNPINSWRVTINYSGNQTVTNSWNANVTQAGRTVTATSVGYNGSLGAGATTSFGFQGTYSGSNAAPSVTCTTG